MTRGSTFRDFVQTSFMDGPLAQYTAICQQVGYYLWQY